MAWGGPPFPGSDSIPQGVRAPGPVDSDQAPVALSFWPSLLHLLLSLPSCASVPPPPAPLLFLQQPHDASIRAPLHPSVFLSRHPFLCLSLGSHSLIVPTTSPVTGSHHLFSLLPGGSRVFQPPAHPPARHLTPFLLQPCPTTWPRSLRPARQWSS